MRLIARYFNLEAFFKEADTTFLPQYDLWHLDWSDSCRPDSGTKWRTDWPHLGGWSECYWNHYCSGGDAILHSASTDHSPGCYCPLCIQGKLIHMYIHRLTRSLSVSRSIDSWMVIIQGWFQLFWSGATCMCSEKSGFEAASGDLIIARKKLNTCTNSGATCCKILKRSWWHGILDTCNVMCIYWSTKVLVRIPLNASTAQTTTMSEGHMCL